uniref:Uncharacterized protein n=1 Tax=Anopheles maculatus TaxID=74869 RepID=A0A182T8S1_9DIPT
MDEVVTVNQAEHDDKPDMGDGRDALVSPFDDQYVSHTVGPIVEVTDDILHNKSHESDGKELLDERRIVDIMEETCAEHGMIQSAHREHMSHQGIRSLMVPGVVSVSTQSAESSYASTIGSGTMPVLAAKRTTILVVEDCIATNGLHSPYESARFTRRRSLNGAENVLSSVPMLKYEPRDDTDNDSALGKRCNNDLFHRGQEEGSCAPEVDEDDGGDGHEHKGGHVDGGVVEEVLASSCGDWPQFKMEMMDATKMMVVDHHQL